MKNGLIFCLSIMLGASSAAARVIRVPEDCPAIQLAVHRAVKGDVIDVADGLYFEKNIILDKAVHMRSRRRFGACIDGMGDTHATIFVVRASVEIEGFVLRNALNGIHQRGSPDVAWAAHDLIIRDMPGSGVAVDDEYTNIGEASLWRILVFNATGGINTNDAVGLRVRDCLMASCQSAFGGSNHFYFEVDEALVVGCDVFFKTSNDPPPGRAVDAIAFGPDVFVLGGDTEEGSRGGGRASHVKIDAFVSRMSDGSGLEESALFATMGDLSLQLEDPDEAESWYRRALRPPHSREDSIWAGDALSGLGRIRRRRGEREKALSFYERAFQEFEITRSRLRRVEDRIRFSGKQIDVYEEALELLWGDSGPEIAEEAAERAFLLSEHAKARGLLESMLGRKEEYGAAAHEIFLIKRELETEDIDVRKRAALLDKWSELERERRNSQKRAGRPGDAEDPKGALRVEVRDIRKALPSKAALIEYFVGRNNVYAFLVTREKIAGRRLAETGTVQGLVENYLRFLTCREAPGFYAGPGSVRLTNMLLGRFQEKIQKDISRLIVIPDGFLFDLPFESLSAVSKPEQGEGFIFLVEKLDIAYMFSAATWLQAGRPGGMGPGALIFANSEFKRTPDYPSQGEGAERPRRKSRKLPHVRREVDYIRNILGEEHIAVFQDREATEARLQTFAGAAFRILHFSTHALIFPYSWWRSALALQPGPDGEYNGFVRCFDFKRLKMKADLCVLSTCSAGSGLHERGEGLRGFSRALLESGTRCVVSSLWSIFDESTAVFMKWFYEGLKEGRTISRALREAKRRMIRGRKYALPFYWAPFVAYGDGFRKIDLIR